MAKKSMKTKSKVTKSKVSYKFPTVKKAGAKSKSLSSDKNGKSLPTLGTF